MLQQIINNLNGEHPRDLPNEEVVLYQGLQKLLKYGIKIGRIDPDQDIPSQLETGILNGYFPRELIRPVVEVDCQILKSNLPEEIYELLFIYTKLMNQE